MAAARTGRLGMLTNTRKSAVVTSFCGSVRSSAMANVRLVFVGAFLSGLLVAPAKAQGTTEVSLLGVSRSPFKTAVGLRYRDFAFLALRRTWSAREDSASRVSISYVLEGVPLAVMTNNPVASYAVPSSSDPWDTGYHIEQRVGTVYAVGASPLGLRLGVKMTDRVSIVANGSGGFLFFDRPVPDPTLQKLNFTATAGLSVQRLIGKKRGVSIGYLRHHTSNAGRSEPNPGMNSNMLQVTLEIIR
jgi:hypothetical protein